MNVEFVSTSVSTQ